MINYYRKGELNPSKDFIVFNYKTDYLEILSINYTNYNFIR
jgi:hypothetical protein